MHVLFFMRHPGFVRNFQAVLEELGRRGHDVELVFDTDRTPWLEGRDPLDALPGVRRGSGPGERRMAWRTLATPVRTTLDYLRYLDPAYAGATALRARAERRAPPGVPRLLRALGARRPRARAGLVAALSALERAIPVDRAVRQVIASRRPDVVLVTPLIGLGSFQGEYLRVARSLGIPAMLCVASWDNLTNKGRIRDVPDRVAVWNAPQRDEAVALHGVPSSEVVVTGAHSYDHWFAWEPSTSRGEFCARVGLPADRTFVLYVGSSQFIAPEETGFVRAWIAALRSSGLANVAVLVRPHPQNAAQWQDADLSDLGAAVVWPRATLEPVDAASRSAFFDSIFFSGAVVGINTSAQIESAIAGRDVLTVLAPEFAATQGGTLHFEHLARDEGGLLHIAASFDEHVAQLSRALAGDEAYAARREAFLRRFVRPLGLDVAAAPVLASAIEELSAAS